MKGGMTGLLKVGEGINSVWENERLWKIWGVNKIHFYLMWWGDTKWGEKKKAELEWWAREVEYRRKLRRVKTIFLKQSWCCQYMRRAWTGAVDAMTDKMAMIEQRWCRQDFPNWEKVKRKSDSGGLAEAVGQLAALVAEAARVKQRASVGRGLQSLVSGAGICGVSVLRHVRSGSNLWSQSPGVFPNSKYLQGGFVRSCRWWMFGEDCPVSPAIWICAFLCQQTVMFTDVTRK